MRVDCKCQILEPCLKKPCARFRAHDLSLSHFFNIRAKHAHPLTIIVDKKQNVRLAYVGADMSADLPAVDAMLDVLRIANVPSWTAPLWISGLALATVFTLRKVASAKTANKLGTAIFLNRGDTVNNDDCKDCRSDVESR